MYQIVVRMLQSLTVAAFVGLATVSQAFEFPTEPELVLVPSTFTGEQWSPAVVESWERTDNTVWDQCGRVLFSYSSSSLATDAGIIKCWEEVAVVNNRSMASLGRLEPGEVIILPLTRSQVAAYEGRVIDRIDVTALKERLAALRGEFTEFTAKLAGVETIANNAKSEASVATTDAANAERIANEARDAVGQLDERIATLVGREELENYVREDTGNPVLRQSDLTGLLTADDAADTYLRKDAVVSGSTAPTVWGWEVDWWWIWIAVATLTIIVLVVSTWLFLRSRTNRKSIAGLVPISRIEKVEKQIEPLEKGVKEAGAKADRALAFAAETARFEGYMFVGDTTKVPLTQHELESRFAKAGDSVVFELAPEDDLDDVRRIQFTRVDDALPGNRPGLKIDGIASQRHPIAIEMSRIFSKFRSAAKGQHLVGIDSASTGKKAA